jgi:tetratricopeptide (TPR) repeat protein
MTAVTAKPPAPDFSRQLRNPALLEAAVALAENRLHDAEPLLRAHLKRDPFDVAAIRMLAELAGRIGRLKDAETLLRRAVELAPNFLAARSNLATVLYKQNLLADALAELDALLSIDPEDAANANLKAAALGRTGDYDEAMTLYEQVLRQHPGQPKLWMSYGHVLKTVGRHDEGVEAYRRALSIAPALGEAWWSLANLKTFAFDDGDIATMEAGLERDDVSPEDRFHLHFALGKAYELRGEAETSFRHYADGNSQRIALVGYDPDTTTEQVDRAIRLFTPALFEARAATGDPSDDPIFIIGMPRAGSTLIEQILSSHPMIEGTMELPDIPALAARIGARGTGIDAASDAELAALGREYLDRTRIQRKTGRPLFIDKLPNNWAHVGLIHLILPNARIIDARRHPLDCCFSNFRQHFARGQTFTYRLDDVGRYYVDYVRLMAHFDAVLPGRVHRVFHETLLDDPEGEVRRLLEYVGVAFDLACLRFHENRRAVRTASSEQVRQPINRDGVDQWKPFEPWLDPLKTALGDVLTAYPDAP